MTVIRESAFAGVPKDKHMPCEVYPYIRHIVLTGVKGSPVKFIYRPRCIRQVD